MPSSSQQLSSGRGARSQASKHRPPAIRDRNPANKSESSVPIAHRDLSLASTSASLEEFSHCKDRLLSGLLDFRQSTPGGDHFYAHDQPRAFLKSGKRRRQIKRLLELLCEATVFAQSTPDSLVDKIIGKDADTSMSRLFLAALTISSTRIRRRFWMQVLDNMCASRVLDLDFTEENTNQRVAIFGVDHGRNTSAYHNLFRPLRLSEGGVVEQHRQVMPLVNRDALAPGEKHFKAALSPGAIVAKNGHSRDGQPLFLKTLKSNSSGTPNEWNIAQRLQANSTQSSNISIPFAATKDRDGRYHLFSDWGGISLTEFMRSHDQSDLHFRPDVLLPSVFLGLASAVKHCHLGLSDYELIHGDLHEGNVLFRRPNDDEPQDYHFLITDFGSARLIDKQRGKSKTAQGSSIHNFGVGTAPETRAKKMLTTASDIWSLARVYVLVYIWAARGQAGLDKLTKALNGDSFYIELDGEVKVHPEVEKHLRKARDFMTKLPHEKLRFSQLYDLLMNDMLCIDPADRKNINDIHEHLSGIVHTDTSVPVDRHHPTRRADGVWSLLFSTISADTGIKDVSNTLMAPRIRLFEVIVLLTGLIFLRDLVSRTLWAMLFVAYVHRAGVA